MRGSAEGAFERIRSEIFERSPALQEVVQDRGARVTAEAITAAAHRIKAWHGLRSQLEPSQVREAIEREEPWALGYGEYVAVLRRIARLERLPKRVDDVEDAIDYLWRLVSRLGRLPPLRNAPARSRPRDQAWWDQDGMYAGTSPADLRLPDDLLAALMGILGDLVSKFLEQLEEAGKFEWPPIPPAKVSVDVRIAGRRDPGAGVGGQLPAGFELADVGTTITIAAEVGAGATATQVSPPMSGPSGIERVALWSDNAFPGSVQLNVQGAGVAYGAAAAFGTIFGEPLLQGATNVGAGGAQIPWTAFGSFAEFWPRRVIARSSYRVILTVSNTSGATRWLVAALDRREVRAV